jgi:hypothetical protein
MPARSGDDGALEGEVEAFGGAGGEDHLAGVGVDQVGDLLGSGFDGGFGAIADGVIEAAGACQSLWSWPVVRPRRP